MELARVGRERHGPDSSVGHATCRVAEFVMRQERNPLAGQTEHPTRLVRDGVTHRLR